MTVDLNGKARREGVVVVQLPAGVPHHQVDGAQANMHSATHGRASVLRGSKWRAEGAIPQLMAHDSEPEQPDLTRAASGIVFCEGPAVRGWQSAELAGAQFCPTIDEAIAAARVAATPGTTLLVKGSRFMRMERVVRGLLEPAMAAQVGGHA